MKSVGIIGLGYVGLPLAVQAASKGYKTYGIDLDEVLVNKVNDRTSPFVNDIRFEKALQSIGDAFEATTDFDVLQQVDIAIICVPTPTTDNDPDLSFVEKAAQAVAGRLKPGQLVILESTVNPGVTRAKVLPLLEELSGLKAGKDFFLAHCPERIDPGNETYYVGNINRVVGGITNACTEKAAQFYKAIIDAEIILLGSAEEAEFVKSWENTHRNVMIALANNAAIICDALGMDISNVLAGMQSKVNQFGLSLAKPGIGPGGHCIPEDIHYVIRKAKEAGVDVRFLEASARLNDLMPQYAIRNLEDILKREGLSLDVVTIGLLGLAYKPNISDARRSPAVTTGNLLASKVKKLLVHDPYVRDATLVPDGHAVEELDELLAKSEGIFLATAHTEYIDRLSARMLKEHGVKYVLDGRNMLNGNEIKAAGIAYIGIGKR